MTDDQDKLRLSNADRDEAVERLQRALDEGRIELGEFDERAKAAYEAKTNAELAVVFADLPGDRAEDRSVHTIDLSDEEREQREAAVRERVAGGRGPGRFQAAGGLIGVGLITVAIWAVTSVVSGRPLYFWPIWPILAFAIPLAVQLTTKRRDR